MNYFIINPDNGDRFGPAGLDLINEWAQQGRIHPNFLIEDTIAGARIRAADMPGLILPLPPIQLPQFREYGPNLNNAALSPNQKSGQHDATMAWVYLALGVGFCSLFLPFAITAANRAEAQGNSSASIARVLSWIMVVISVIAVLICVFLLVQAASY